MFYHFRQNNSGGYFDDMPAHVFIEAENAEQANEDAIKLGIYFDGVRKGRDCECCGDRWYRTFERIGMETPMLFGEPIDPNDSDVMVFRR